MSQQLVYLTLLVTDYDEAIEFYTQKLGFELVEDTVLTPVKRWVVVRPPGSTCGLLLAKPSNDRQMPFVGNQTGGRVFLFLHTDDFERDYANLLKHNISIIRGPVEELYGKVAVFEDLYGNKWDLIEPVT